MKKLLIGILSVGFFLGSQASAPVRMPAIAGQNTQLLGAASIATVGLGALVWAVGHCGAANTVGTVIAAGVGGAAGVVSQWVIQQLIASQICPLFLAANPLVAPVTIGVTAGGLLFWLRKNYLSSHSKELEEFGSIVTKAGITLGTISAISYALNIFNIDVCSPFYTKLAATPPAL